MQQNVPTGRGFAARLCPSCVQAVAFLTPLAFLCSMVDAAPPVQLGATVFVARPDAAVLDAPAPDARPARDCFAARPLKVQLIRDGWLRVCGKWITERDVVRSEEAREFFASMNDDRLSVFAVASLSGVHLSDKEVGEALAQAEAAMRLDPSSALARYCRAMARIATKDYTGAVSDFTSAADSNPSYTSAYTGRCVAHLGLLDYDGALADLDAAHQVDPHDGRVPRMRENVLKIRAAIGPPLRATAGGGDSVREPLKGAPSDAYAQRGDEALELGDFATAREALAAAVRLDPDSAYLHFLYGLALNSTRDPDGAIAEFERAKELGGKRPQARLFEFARAQPEEADRKSPAYGMPDDEVDWWLVTCRSARANTLLREGDPARAVDDLNKAVELAPRAWSVICGRASALFSAGNYADALLDCDLAIRLNPFCGDAYCVRSDIQMRQGKLKLAMSSANRAIAVAPDLPDGYATRSSVWRRVGQPAQALSDISRAIELAPDSAAFYRERADLYDGLGEAELAARDVEVAIRLEQRTDHGPRTE